jgi:hypothetical protein
MAIATVHDAALMVWWQSGGVVPPGVSEESLVASEYGGGQDADPLKPPHSMKGARMATALP